MRYFIFTDIHGNLEAFNTILKFSKKHKIDYYLFLGDLVGYGASPNEIIQKIRTLKPISMIRGNHDKAVCGLDTIQTFNPIAALAIYWTKANIHRSCNSYLYQICFFGHTHFHFVYTEKDHLVEGTFLTGDKNEIKLEKGTRYLINPGSVGQPRDRNNKAACAIFDTNTQRIKFFRLEYNIQEAQKKILDANLPPALAERLWLGI